MFCQAPIRFVCLWFPRVLSEQRLHKNCDYSVLQNTDYPNLLCYAREFPPFSYHLSESSNLPLLRRWSVPLDHRHSVWCVVFGDNHDKLNNLTPPPSFPTDVTGEQYAFQRPSFILPNFKIFKMSFLVYIANCFCPQRFQNSAPFLRSFLFIVDERRNLD